jgi:hypothetical protein
MRRSSRNWRPSRSGHPLPDARIPQCSNRIQPLANDLLDVTLAVAAVLDDRGIPYSVGGSLASIKVDLFPASSLLDRQQLDRRQGIQVATNPDRFLYIHSPEDILLQKLHWYRRGGGVSDRQWRDVLAILLVQGRRLDANYLRSLAERIGVGDRLERARLEAGDNR